MSTRNKVFLAATFVAFVLSGFVAAIYRTPLTIAAYAVSVVMLATLPTSELFNR